MKQIILLSDTHHHLDRRFYKHFENADEIWHAGDIGSISIIDELKKFATVRAVSGNIDNYIINTEFKNTIFFKCEELKVLITHIGGIPGIYNKNILPIIKEKKPNIFISGHSHILKIIYDKKHKLLNMNPGAAGQFGCHKVKTILSFKIRKKNITDLKIIELKKLTNPINRLD